MPNHHRLGDPTCRECGLRVPLNCHACQSCGTDHPTRRSRDRRSDAGVKFLLCLVAAGLLGLVLGVGVAAASHTESAARWFGIVLFTEICVIAVAAFAGLIGVAIQTARKWLATRPNLRRERQSLLAFLIGLLPGCVAVQFMGYTAAILAISLAIVGLLFVCALAQSVSGQQRRFGIEREGLDHEL